MEKIQGKKFVVSYSKNQRLGYSLLQAVPYDDIFYLLSQMRVKAVALTFLFFGIGAATSYLLAYWFLSPLYALLRKYNYHLPRKNTKPLSEVAFLDHEMLKLSYDAEKSQTLMRRLACYDLLLNQSLSDNVTETVLTSLSAFFNYIAATNYEYAMTYISRLVIDLFYFSLESLPSTASIPVHSLLPEIHRSRSLSQAKALLERLCLETAECCVPQKPQYSQAVRQAMELTEQNLTRVDFSINTVADALNITSSYFNRVFKREYGVSYGEYLNATCLKYAKTLLHTTELSISEICTRSGFSNLSYFYTLFKKNYDITPMEFRGSRERKNSKNSGR